MRGPLAHPVSLGVATIYMCPEYPAFRTPARPGPAGQSPVLEISRHRVGGAFAGVTAGGSKDMTHEYKLYCWDRPDLTGHITAYADDEHFWIEDYSIGDTCENFLGREEHEYRVGVDKAGAEKLLGAMGFEPGKYPLDWLALFVARVYDGSPHAATEFKELAEEHDVKPEVSVW
jgi:hypothetical protein